MRNPYIWWFSSLYINPFRNGSPYIPMAIIHISSNRITINGHFLQAMLVKSPYNPHIRWCSSLYINPFMDGSPYIPMAIIHPLGNASGRAGFQDHPSDHLPLLAEFELTEDREKKKSHFFLSTQFSIRYRYWLVVWLPSIWHFPRNIKGFCHHPNWRTPSFFRTGWVSPTTNQRCAAYGDRGELDVKVFGPSEMMGFMGGWWDCPQFMYAYIYTYMRIYIYIYVCISYMFMSLFCFSFSGVLWILTIIYLSWFGSHLKAAVCFKIT